MAESLIRLDDKHISVNQLQMAGCKLDPKLISALVERWRPKTHTFHLSCGECTIILEDVQLQLGLPMNESVVTRSVQSANWGTVCYELLGVVPEMITGGRIEMARLRNNFVKLAKDSTKERRVQYAWTYILQIIWGILMPDKS
ncbi:hypothetical protein Goari_006895 [Gossypium aridum]|uniref:Aminotransferase-like plant mobile domain-containing protein n=1 Tax=Gossypium aridum TaxID=34290 RepID=A0A7J8XPB1_GOSAI|nr:hypothetical protein [Gossypium aridum]